VILASICGLGNLECDLRNIKCDQLSHFHASYFAEVFLCLGEYIFSASKKSNNISLVKQFFSKSEAKNLPSIIN